MPPPPAHPPTTDGRPEVDGRTIALHQTGDPDAPPLVFLHGIMGHGREWDPAARILATDHRVIAPDQRGHGRSAWADDYTADAMAADVVALIEAMAAGPVHLVGHSMGGINAILTAQARPDLVRSLTVLDIGPETLRSAQLRAEFAGYLATLAATTYRTVDDAVVAWLAGDPLARPDLLRHYVEHNLLARRGGDLAWRFDPHIAQFVLAAPAPDPLWRALDAISVPSLVVRGRHSPFLDPDQADEMARRLGDSRVVEISGGAHDLGVQQPEAVAAAVADLISDVVPSTPGPADHLSTAKEITRV